MFSPYVIAGSTHELIVDLSLQSCPNVTFEEVAALGEFCPSGRDSSLNRLVLVFVSGAVSLSKVDVAFNDSRSVCCWHILVSFFHHHLYLCLRFVHLQT